MPKFTMKGRVTTLASEITAVRLIERAVSPFARWVKRLEVTPPGQAARIRKPTARTGSRPKLACQPSTSARAISGSSSIWQSAPTAKAFGRATTRLKSSATSARPMENIMKASASGSTTWVTRSICAPLAPAVPTSAPYASSRSRPARPSRRIWRLRKITISRQSRSAGAKWSLTARLISWVTGSSQSTLRVLCSQ